MDAVTAGSGDRLAPAAGPALLYDGRIGEIYPIFLMNLVLTIITLGIFQFWAVTRLRRYVWSRFRFQGERLEYTGTGGELFRGLLLAILALIGLGIIAVGLAFVLALIHPGLAVIPMLALYGFIFVLVGAAGFQAQRYRLSRTLWCGIRGGMEGSSLRYGVRFVLYGILTFFTLTFIVPWSSVWLANRRLNASWFGNAKFAASARGGPLFGVYLVTFLISAALLVVLGLAAYPMAAPYLATAFRTQDPSDPARMMALRQLQLVIVIAVVVFGILFAIIYCWFGAAFIHEIAGHTSLGGVSFASTATGGALASLLIGNGLILLLTLGFGYPIALQRKARFVANTLRASGTLDAAVLTQSTQWVPTTGEGWFQLFNHSGVL
jgi:uncharacterized membrane protein YjgN (DUF898 family)